MSVRIEEEISQSRGAQPRALVVTIYGLYAREAGGLVQRELAGPADA